MYVCIYRDRYMHIQMLAYTCLVIPREASGRKKSWLVGATRGGSFCWKVLSSTISLSISKMPAFIWAWMLASVVCINKPSPRSFRSNRSLHVWMYAHITALLTSSRSKTHSLSSHILQMSDNEKKPAVCEPLFLRTVTRKHVQNMLRHIPVRRDDMWQNSVDSALKGLPRPSSLRWYSLVCLRFRRRSYYNCQCAAAFSCDATITMTMTVVMLCYDHCYDTCACNRARVSGMCRTRSHLTLVLLNSQCPQA